METQGNLSDFDNNRTPPKNNMTLSVIGTIVGLCPTVCCIGFILGIIAIVLSSQVNSKFAAGDYQGAAKSANTAKILSLISIGLAILGIILQVVAIFSLGGIEAYMQMVEEMQAEWGF